MRRSFLFNLVVAILLFVALYMAFFASLRCITRHGKEVKIPDVTGKDMAAAVTQLEGMGFEVYVDSTYEPKQKSLLVLKQTPDIGSIVKKGRTVFITVNKVSPPETPMPNLMSLSYRSAEMILKNNKLILGDTTYKPDIAAGAVLQQMWKGADIKPGQMIPEGSKIDLVLGDGLGVTQFNVPNVVGMTYDEGTALITGNGLQYTAIWEGPITDSATAIIYDETPKPFNELNAPNRIKAGDLLDLRIKQTPSQDEMGGNNTNSQGNVK